MDALGAISLYSNVSLSMQHAGSLPGMPGNSGCRTLQRSVLQTVEVPLSYGGLLHSGSIFYTAVSDFLGRK